MNLCLDIGGTNLRIANVINNKIINKKIVKVPKNKIKLLNALDSLIKEYKYDKIGVSIAGFVKNGRLIKTPNLDLNNFNLKKYLKKFNVPVKIENDARCAALAEKKFGSAKKYKNFILIVIGTGLGGAIFINNKLYIGKSFAGEFGHMFVKNGELEKLSSGKKFNSIKNRAKAIEIISEEISEGLNNIVYSFDPEVIIIGGGLSSVPRLLKKIKEKAIKKDIVHRKIKILRVKLKDDAGLIGASLI